MTAALPARLRDCMRSLPRPRVPHAIVPAALGLLLAAMATGMVSGRLVTRWMLKSFSECS